MMAMALAAEAVALAGVAVDIIDAGGGFPVSYPGIVPPPLDDYKPTADGQPPLARAKEWVNLPDGSTRETNTMPQWAGSCWYYLRYLDATNTQSFAGKTAESYWMGTTAAHVAGSSLDHTSETLRRSEANRPDSPAAVKPTTGVDLYVGGTEHAVLHLLYARFWHKVLFDLGHVSTPEPFFKLVNQGLILGELEFTKFECEMSNGDTVLVSADELKDITAMSSEKGLRLGGTHKATGKLALGTTVSADEVEKVGAGYCLKANPDIRIDARSYKMSKSRGNVINPDDILADYGADAFRLYEMFMGPLEMVKPWNTRGVEGVYRFLGRVWRLFVDEKSETEFEQGLTAEPDRAPEWLDRIQLHPAIQDVAPTHAQLKALHACIKKVTEDLDGLRFNTGIAALMVFVNAAMTWDVKPSRVMREFLILLQPFAPHLAEELWGKLHSALRAPHSALSYAPWPKHDPALLVEDTLEIAVQVNGKLRDVIRVPATATDDEIKTAALSAAKAQPFLAGKQVRKLILVPRKLVNIAVA